jgi:prepilin-type N-terminal cleavage/methylation domain-containing protein
MKNNRGVTLVELMIVIAIIGILAAAATVAYSQYVRSAQTEKLKQYALEIASGQERYRARNNFYWDGGDYTSDVDGYKNLLDFNHTVPSDIEVTTQAWDGTGPTCNICDGAPFDDSAAGFAVRVRRDFEAGGPKATVVVTNDTENPILTNEGE